MTLASDIIQAAYRESNLIAVGAEPTTVEQTEGLARLNSLLLGAIGFQVGNELRDINIGGQYDQSLATCEWTPENVRLVLNAGGPSTVRLHPWPHDGQRLAVIDVGMNLAANHLVLDGNGRKIESTTTLTLAENGLSRQWFYRADLGRWLRYTDITLTDELPYPAEFDDYFTVLLAMRLNPLHGRAMAQESAVWLEGKAAQIEARYRRPRPQQDWGSLGLLGQRDRFGEERALFNGGTFL